MKSLFVLAAAFSFSACTPPKPAIPALTPEGANQLLHYHPRAQTWMMHVKKENPNCDYKIELPDQTSHPTQLDVSHIVVCGSAQSPRALDATVSFEYDAANQRWVIKRFSS
jgi:hypothetical protein